MPPRNRDPPEDPEQAGKAMLTAKEGEVFFFFVKNIRNKPDIDWDGFAIDCGWKNSDTAKVRMGQIKRKLGLGNWGENLGSGDGGAGPSGSGPPPAAPAPKPPKAPKTPRAPKSTTKSRKAAQPAGNVALGPSTGGGVSKSHGNKSSSARSKVEKDALIAAAIDKKNTAQNSPKDEEEPEAPEEEKVDPKVEASQGIDEDALMDLVEDNKLGQITKSPITRSPEPISTKAPKRESLLKTETNKAIPALARSQATASDVPLHPAYISELLSPIPGTTGSFQTAHVQPTHVQTAHAQTAQAQVPPPRRKNNDPSPPSASVQSPLIKDWESDEDTKAIHKFRNGDSTSNNSRNNSPPPPARILNVDPTRYSLPPRPAPFNRHHISAHNLNTSGGSYNFDDVPELSLSSMMSGGLPGGGSAVSHINTHSFSLAQPALYRNAFNLQAAYTPSTQPQMQQHYDLTEEDEAEAAHPDPNLFTTRNSLFGGGSSGGRGSSHGRGGSGRK